MDKNVPTETSPPSRTGFLFLICREPRAAEEAEKQEQRRREEEFHSARYSISRLPALASICGEMLEDQSTLFSMNSDLREELQEKHLLRKERGIQEDERNPLIRKRLRLGNSSMNGACFPSSVISRGSEEKTYPDSLFQIAVAEDTDDCSTPTVASTDIGEKTDASYLIETLDRKETETSFLITAADREIDRNSPSHILAAKDATSHLISAVVDEEMEQPDTNSLIPTLGREISIECLLHLSRSDYVILASVNRSFRSLLRSGQLYKVRRLAGICEEWIYLSFNVPHWEGFDPYLQRWMNMPPMPSDEFFICSDKQSLAVGTEILVFGRQFNSLVVYKYSILTNSWSFGTNMKTPRCLFAAAALGEIAICAGGYDSKGNVLDSVELYNSEDGTWETLPPMNIPRKMCSSFFMDGKYYVIGGHSGMGESYTCGEEYNFQTMSWRLIPDMFPFAAKVNNPPPLISILNNELYAADYTEKIVIKYYKAQNSWIPLGGLPERTASVNGWGFAFRACGERLIAIGGPGGTRRGILEINSWIPGDGPPQWELLASKPSSGFVYNCAIMGC